MVADIMITLCLTSQGELLAYCIIQFI